MSNINTNSNLTDELVFLSLNQFVKCKRNSKYDYGVESHKLKDRLPLSYNDSIHLIYYLQLQQSFLNKKGYGFSIIGVDDIIVIERELDDNIELMFACINSLNLKKINEKGDIVFMSPFSREGRFCSPEILALNSIPSSVSHKCFYYSLGALCLYCLSIDTTIIKGTKLYWLIKRIMNVDPTKRILLMT
jgi:hypothetical protein